MFLRVIYLCIHILILSKLSCSGGELRRGVPFLPRQEQFTLNIAHLIEYIYSQGYKCTFGETYRTQEMAQIYSKEGKGIVNSNHCFRLAIDLNLFDSDGNYLHDSKDYKQFGEFWEKLNPFNEWGGRWTKRYQDPFHFEMD